MRDEDVMTSFMDEIPWKNPDDVIHNVELQLDLVRNRVQRTMAEEGALEKERRQKVDSEVRRRTTNWLLIRKESSIWKKLWPR